MKPLTPQQRLYAYFGGSRRVAAEKLEVSRETVRLWLINGIPLERAIFVERKTQGFITADEVLNYARRYA